LSKESVLETDRLSAQLPGTYLSSAAERARAAVDCQSQSCHAAGGTRATRKDVLYP